MPLKGPSIGSRPLMALGLPSGFDLNLLLATSGESSIREGRRAPVVCVPRYRLLHGELLERFVGFRGLTVLLKELDSQNKQVNLDNRCIEEKWYIKSV